MPCYHPMVAYRSKQGRSPTGAWPITFNKMEGYIDQEVVIPCGQCIGCRLERSRQWAIRCVHEASQWEDNCFVTLTYNDDNIDKKYSLNKEDFVLFMKKLRKKFGPKIRFFHCGEYGEMLNRPHHHACIFNFDFIDKQLWSIRNNVKLYRSEILDKIWGYGYCTIGDVTFESAAYVARYVTKKITGKNSENFYGDRLPEYNTMSLRPGIGKDWIKKYNHDVYVNDKIIVRNDIQCKPPRYYDKIFDDIGKLEHDELERIKRYRVKRGQASADNDYDRLSVREQIQKLKYKKLVRTYEGNFKL